MTSGDIIRSDAGSPAIRRAALRRMAVFLPALIFVGMAVSSRSTTSIATAQFRDLTIA